MRGCLQVLAGVVAVVFVITAVFALFVVNLAQGITDREAMKEALNLEPLVRRALPVLLADSIRQQAQQQGLPIAQIDQDALQEAVDIIVPEGFVDQTTASAVDGLYDYLETGDLSQAEVVVDVRPLLERLRGESGQRATLLVVQSLPTCTDPLAPEDLQGDAPEIEGCLPPNVPAEQAARLVHQELVASLDANPQLVEQTGQVRLNLFNSDRLTQQEMVQLRRVQRNFMLVQRWSWLLWLIPLGCLLAILIFAVRSLSEFGHWWGWPLLIAGGGSLLLAAIVPGLLLLYSRTAAGAPAGLGVTPSLILRRLSQSLVDLWLQDIYLQGGIMTAAGLGLVVLGFVAGHPSKKEEWDTGIQA